MFRNVPECSGMFHVLGFIDALSPCRSRSLVNSKLVMSHCSCAWTAKKCTKKRDSLLHLSYSKVKVKEAIFPETSCAY